MANRLYTKWDTLWVWITLLLCAFLLYSWIQAEDKFDITFKALQEIDASCDSTTKSWEKSSWQLMRTAAQYKKQRDSLQKMLNEKPKSTTRKFGNVETVNIY